MSRGFTLISSNTVRKSGMLFYDVTDSGIGGNGVGLGSRAFTLQKASGNLICFLLLACGVLELLGAREQERDGIPVASRYHLWLYRLTI